MSFFFQFVSQKEHLSKLNTSGNSDEGKLGSDLLPHHLQSIHEYQSRAENISPASSYENSPVKLESLSHANPGHVRGHGNTFQPMESERLMTSFNVNQYGRPVGYPEWNDVTRNRHPLFSNQQYSTPVPPPPAHTRLAPGSYGWETAPDVRQQPMGYGMQGELINK